MKADFGKTDADYRNYRAGFPESFFESLQERGLIRGSEAVLDLGTGTGTIARSLATIGCKVTAVDPSGALLAQAKELAELEGQEINWRQATAEDTQLEGHSFDVAIAGQCWHWFDASKAIDEVKRILRNDSLLVIAHFDWLSFSGNVVQRTAELIKEMNPGWDYTGSVGIYPKWFRHLSEGGFRGIQSYTYDEDVVYTHEGWRGRMRACGGVGGSMDSETIEAYDRSLADILSKEFPEDPLSIPHRVFVVYGKLSSQQGEVVSSE